MQLPHDVQAALIGMGWTPPAEKDRDEVTLIINETPATFYGDIVMEFDGTVILDTGDAMISGQRV